MSLFSISDLHLSLGVDKPMDKFGSRWQGYIGKLERNWRAVVGDGDTVVIPGDISWGLSFDEALPDFKFIDSLPGRKLIGKGNHDLWWSTVTKMERAFAEHGITTVSFLHNNAYLVEDYIISGTRGWFLDERLQNTAGEADFRKISAREAIRLESTLKAARELAVREGREDAPILVYLHFPPVYRDFIFRELIDILHAYGVKDVYYGHIHGVYTLPASFNFEGIDMRIISADYLNFVPLFKPNY